MRFKNEPLHCAGTCQDGGRENISTIITFSQSFCKKSYLQIENTEFCLLLQQLS